MPRDFSRIFDDDYHEEGTDLCPSIHPASNPNCGEAAKYGIFFDDRDYDYMQHMCEPASSRQILYSFTLPTATSKDLLEDPIPTADPVQDPDILQTLEALEDDAFVTEEGLDDDFFLRIDGVPVQKKAEERNKSIDREFERLLIEEYNDSEESSEPEECTRYSLPESALPNTQTELEYLREGLRAPSFVDQYKNYVEIEDESGSASEGELLPVKQVKATAKCLGQGKQKSRFVPKLIVERSNK